jgi:hypothetical protein
MNSVMPVSIIGIIMHFWIIKRMTNVFLLRKQSLGFLGIVLGYANILFGITRVLAHGLRHVFESLETNLSFCYITVTWYLSFRMLGNLMLALLSIERVISFYHGLGFRSKLWTSLCSVVWIYTAVFAAVSYFNGNGYMEHNRCTSDYGRDPKFAWKYYVEYSLMISQIGALVAISGTFVFFMFQAWIRYKNAVDFRATTTTTMSNQLTSGTSNAFTTTNENQNNENRNNNNNQDRNPQNSNVDRTSYAYLMDYMKKSALLVVGHLFLLLPSFILLLIRQNTHRKDEDNCFGAFADFTYFCEVFPVFFDAIVLYFLVPNVPFGLTTATRATRA